MCRTRIPTNLGSSPLVLGLHPQWAPRRLCSPMVDCADSMAVVIPELRLRLRLALWFARYVYVLNSGAEY